MINELIFRLCETFSGAGNEKAIAEVIKTEMQNYSDKIIVDKNFNVICKMGKNNAARHLLFEAHIDQISMLVTAIDDAGFLKVSPCGGVDCRVLPGATVLIHGKEIITGIVCTNPPHLASKEKAYFEKTEDLIIDTGLTKGKACEIISVGDYVSFSTKPQKLIGNRVTAPGLDNRAGVAGLIRCAQLLKSKQLDCEITFLFSAQEEVHVLGAKTAVFAIEPTESITVDVSFASQPNILKEKCGKLCGGPMIGIAPSLSKEISDKLRKLAEQNNIPYQFEIMSSATGTTSDMITVSKNGIAGGLLSIPERYMHTPVEVVDIDDIEYTARLLELYALNGGNNID